MAAEGRLKKELGDVAKFTEGVMAKPVQEGESR